MSILPRLATRYDRPPARLVPALCVRGLGLLQARAALVGVRLMRGSRIPTWLLDAFFYALVVIVVLIVAYMVGSS